MTADVDLAYMAAVDAAYQKHIFDKGLTEDSLDPATLEGEVWFILHPNTEAPKEAEEPE